jgi:hypothetical protein
MRTLIAIMAAALLVISMGTAGAVPDTLKLSVDEAKSLVGLVVSVANPAKDIESMQMPDDPNFLFFSATWASPAGEPMNGYFGVNPATGDVWDIACHHESNPALRHAQAEIKKRFALPTREYKRLSALKPIC